MRVLITPEMASQLLENNTNNRPPIKGRVRALSKEIKKGRWKYNGETIKISEDGRLLDGQHRLMAVVATQMPIESELITGIADDVFYTIDVGAVRTNAHNLATIGVKNYTNIGTAINNLNLICLMNHRSLGASRLSKSEVMDFYRKNKELLSFGDSVHCSKKLLTPSITITIASYLSLFNNKEIIIDFFEKISKGVSPDEYPSIHLLREFLLTNQSGRKRVDKVLTSAMVLKAFNKFKHNEKVKNLRWSEGANERFPYDENHFRPINLLETDMREK